MQKEQIIQWLCQAQQQQRLAHAYLFAGPSGSGRYTVALQLANLFLYGRVTPIEARIQEGLHPDVHCLQSTGKNLSKEELQPLYKEIMKTGLESKKQVFIIQNADRLTPAAGNQLLKVMEEPDSQSLFIFIVEQRQKVLATLLSRVQTFSFSPKEEQNLGAQLQEQGLTVSLAQTLCATWDSASLQQAMQEPQFKERVQQVAIWIELLAQRNPLAFPFVQMHLLPLVASRSKNLEQRQIQEQLLHLAFSQALQLQDEPLLTALSTADRYLQKNVNFQHILEYIACEMMKEG